MGIYNADAAKARILELVKANASDNAFIQEVLKLDKQWIPFDVLSAIDANKAKWDDTTKAAVFENCFNGRVLVKEEAAYLDKAVKKWSCFKSCRGQIFNRRCFV